MRSTVSGSTLRMAFCRRVVVSRSHRSGKKKPAIPLTADHSAAVSGVGGGRSGGNTICMSSAMTANVITAPSLSPTKVSTVRLGGAPAMASLTPMASA